jgi:hypothetical protein
MPGIAISGEFINDACARTARQARDGASFALLTVVVKTCISCFEA